MVWCNNSKLYDNLPIAKAKVNVGVCEAKSELQMAGYHSHAIRSASQSRSELKHLIAVVIREARQATVEANQFEMRQT